MTHAAQSDTGIRVPWKLPLAFIPGDALRENTCMSDHVSLYSVLMMP